MLPPGPPYPRPATVAPERVSRRGITLTPNRGGEVILAPLHRGRPRPREIVKEAA
jgi:hypothetical protein